MKLKNKHSNEGSMESRPAARDSNRQERSTPVWAHENPQSTPPVRLNVRWLCVVREWQESGQISPGRSSIAFRAEEPSTRVRTMPKTLQSTRAISNSTLRELLENWM